MKRIKYSILNLKINNKCNFELINIIEETSNAPGVDEYITGATAKGGGFCCQSYSEFVFSKIVWGLVYVSINGPKQNGEYIAKIVEKDKVLTDEKPDVDPNIIPQSFKRTQELDDLDPEFTVVIDLVIVIQNEAQYEMHGWNISPNDFINEIKGNLRSIYSANSRINVAFGVVGAYDVDGALEVDSNDKFRTISALNNWIYSSASMKSRRNKAKVDLVIAVFSN